MQPSFIFSTIFLFGIITLSSSNRIPSGYQLCRVACANHARNCRFIDDCPSSCAKDDYHCSLQVCLDISCTSKGKRDQIETTEVQIWWAAQITRKTSHHQEVGSSWVYLITEQGKMYIASIVKMNYIDS